MEQLFIFLNCQTWLILPELAHVDLWIICADQVRVALAGWDSSALCWSLTLLQVQHEFLLLEMAGVQEREKSHACYCSGQSKPHSQAQSWSRRAQSQETAPERHE